jgi:hypothetical protein
VSKRYRPFALALTVTLCLVTALAAPALAIDITPSSPEGSPFNANQALQVVWDTGDPPPAAWMQAPISAGALAARHTTGSNPTYAQNPTFISSGIDGVIYYLDYTTAKKSAFPLCPTNSAPLACTRHRSLNWPNSWAMAFIIHNWDYDTPSNYTVKWCDNVDQGTCWDVQRVAVHEFGHVLDLGHNTTDQPSNTVMFSETHSKYGSGGQIHEFRSCDIAKLQLKYDMSSTSGVYADCLENAPNAGANGLLTTVTVDTPPTVACLNEPVIFSGNLNVQSPASGYGLLAGNDLGSRTVNLQRSSPGAGSYSDYTTDATSSAGVWTKNLQFGVSTNYDWRSQFDTESGLNADTSPGVNVRWSSAC